jgi:uncharacterized surface protein with fasciclin (FAS1) repeats
MAFSRASAAAPLLVLVVLAGTFSAGEAAPASGRKLLQYPSIAELVSTTPDFSTLNAAIKAAGLTSTLSNSSLAWTVFAPTNAAFDDLFQDLNTTAAAVLRQTNLLSAILSYHVVPSPVKAAQLSDGQQITTLLGQAIGVEIEGTSVMLVGAQSEALVTSTDISAGSSIVHIINGVLLPKL